MKVRRATLDDLDAARDLIIQTWLGTYVPIHGEKRVRSIIDRWHTPQKIASQITSEKQLFGLGLIDDKVVGHVSAFMEAELLKISRLYILFEAQSQGLGERLFEFALAQFPDAEGVVLEVDQQNTGAIRFYQRLGMKISGATDKCGNDSDISALIMSMDISVPR